MNSRDLARGIHSAEKHLTFLQKHTATTPTDPALLQDAVEQLATVLEELRAAEHALHVQGDELATQQWTIAGELYRFREIFDFAPDGYLITTPEAIIMAANRSAAELLGVRSVEYLVGKPLAVFVPLPDRRAFRTQLLLADSTRRDWEATLQPRRRPPFHSELTLTVVENRAGKAKQLLWVIRDITERKEAERSFSELSSRLLRSQDQERRRISQDLHESTAQMLAGLMMNLALVRESQSSLDATARQALTEGVQLADQCLREVRTLSYLLHPPLLDEVGLASAVRWYVDAFAQRTGVQVEVHVSPALTRHPQEVETILFRVVQECLANVDRHSGSPTARIYVRQEPRALTLQVADRGRGMPAELLNALGEPRGGLGVGIASMRARLRQRGGELTISSGPTGTLVTAMLPSHALTARNDTAPADVSS